MKILILTIAAVFVLIPHAKAEVLNDGRLSWAQFECALYSSMGSDNKAAEKQHFDSGYESLKVLLEKLEQGEINDEQIQKEIPIGIILLIAEGGPSADFIIGRVYNTVYQDAYDEVVKEDRNGTLLPPEKWRRDEELIQIMADNLYNKSNCGLLL